MPKTFTTGKEKERVRRKKYKAYLGPSLEGEQGTVSIPRNTQWRKFRGAMGDPVARKSSCKDESLCSTTAAVEGDNQSNQSECSAAKDDQRQDSNNLGERGQLLNPVTNPNILSSEMRIQDCEEDLTSEISLDLEGAGSSHRCANPELDTDGYSEVVDNSDSSNDQEFDDIGDSQSRYSFGQGNFASEEEPSKEDFVGNLLGNSGETFSSAASGGEILLMLIVFAVRHSLPYVAVVDLLQLINTIFGKCVVPGSKYLFKKACAGITGEATQHFFCKFCSSYFGANVVMLEFDPIHCPGCKKECSMMDLDFFLTLPVGKQIKTILENQGENQLNYRHKAKHNPSAIEDILDGILYQELKEPGGFLDDHNNFSYIFNTDGCPLFKSSNRSLWPIYMKLNELPPKIRNKNVILCGVWVGEQDPKMDLFLREFVKLGQKLFHEGVNWTRNGKTVCSKFVCVCCCVDSIARPKVQCTTQFNGYYGCPWCYHSGEICDGQVKYPVLTEKVKERKDNEMLNHMCKAVEMKKIVKGVKGPSPLMNMPLFRVVRGFVPDYMHAVCLGVVRQLALLWCDTTGEQFYIGRPATMREINDRLAKIQPPRCITRLPRSLADRKFWKANEWRNWLLFYSLPCLEGILPTVYLCHWALLVQAMFLLLSECVLPKEVEEANLLLNEFVIRMEWLYGKAKMTFNVHVLLHLAGSVRDWGPLWAHSAFPFESANRKLLTFVKGPKGVDQQISSWFLLYQAIGSLKKVKISNVSVFCKKLLGMKLDGNASEVSDYKLLGSGSHVVGSVAEVKRMLTSKNIELSAIEEYRKVQLQTMILCSVQQNMCTRRNDCVALLRSGIVGEILHIYLEKCTGACFIILRKYEKENETQAYKKLGWNVSHLKLYKKGDLIFANLEEVVSKCICINLKNMAVISHMPNEYEGD